MIQEPEETAKPGPWGGSSFAYRAARIECLPGDHVCSLFLIGHPLSGLTSTALGRALHRLHRRRSTSW